MAPEREAILAMVRVFESIGVHGEIVVGGSVQTPGFEQGGQLGAQGKEVDIAAYPLEGGISCALGGPNAMSIMSLCDKGGFIRCPANSYMEKIATVGRAAGMLDLDQPAAENLRRLAEILGTYVEDITVVILDRPRHDRLVEEVRAAGARVRLIPHGDVAAAMAAARDGSGIDLLMGTGGAAQGIMSAAAIKCMGGMIQCRFKPRSHSEADALYELGIHDLERKLDVDDMASGNVLFAATGVTNGEYLDGVRFFKGGATTNSVVMRSVSGTVRLLETHHRFDYRPDYR